MRVLILVLLLPIILLAQTDCQKCEQNPVLNVGEEGSWDGKAVVEPSVIFDSNVFKMWYTGYDGSSWRVGYATSTDGMNWTKHIEPVMDVGEEGSWDNHAASTPCVIFHQNIYKMWYIGNDGDNMRIGYATSTDGISWSKYVEPVMDVGEEGSWDDGILLTPRVIYVEPDYFMFYSSYNDGKGSKIGMAKSPDGINWIKGNDHNPVLIPSLSWEDNQLSVGSVLYIDNMFCMWYTGGSGGHKLRSGYATSEDGINWEKNDSYILNYGIAGEWDYKFASIGSAYFNGEIYSYWYDSYNYNENTGAIGYATSTVVSVEEEMVIPKEYSLSQNYPNPFNPSTKIKYSIPKQSNVTLKIFDVLGREVTTLVNKEQAVGNYEVEFDASDLTSGIYFYRIQAGDFVESKKMVLMK